MGVACICRKRHSEQTEYAIDPASCNGKPGCSIHFTSAAPHSGNCIFVRYRIDELHCVLHVGSKSSRIASHASFGEQHFCQYFLPADQSAFRESSRGAFLRKAGSPTSFFRYLIRRIRELKSMVPEFVARPGGSKWGRAQPGQSAKSRPSNTSEPDMVWPLTIRSIPYSPPTASQPPLSPSLSVT